MKYKRVRIPTQKVQLRIYNDEIDITFESIKELAKYLKLDMSKSTNTVALSVFSKQYPNCIHHQSDYNRGEQFLKDYTFERVDYKVLEIYVHDERFKDYEYGWYLISGSHNNIFNGGAVNDNRHENNRVRNWYKESYTNIIEELPRLKNIKFTNKDYKEV